MLFLAAINPNILGFVILGIVIIGLGLLLRYFKQPYVIAYIIAGVLLGEHGFEIITDKSLIEAMGEFGLILLLFFIGMELNLENLVKNWKIATIGTIAQVLLSILFAGLVGWYFGWNIQRIIILGFVVSLSSSAVVIKILQDNKELNTSIGQNVISILLMQDILIVPMLIIAGYLGGQIPSGYEIILQLVGGILIIGTIIWIVDKKHISLPFSKAISNDKELQVFVAFSLCFGGALLTALFGLSAALGAFVAGIAVHASQSTEWFHDSLHSFRIIFVALFFVSIGVLIDLQFLYDNWEVVSMMLLIIYLSNHLINTLILRYFKGSWKSSLYGGALLAQIGELSFILVASAYYNEIISSFTYQLTIVVIALSLLISPFWISATKNITKFRH